MGVGSGVEAVLGPDVGPGDTSADSGACAPSVGVAPGTGGPGPLAAADANPIASAASTAGRARLGLLVDETQDVDRSQLRLALLLAAPANRIFLVGDDNQSYDRSPPGAPAPA
jgi:hypothetical protein